MNTRSFPEQLSDMWRTRPVRLPRQGHVAGVCAGIGVRYDVDPVLIRVAFVVSTFFGGAGLVLYLAGWLLLPRYGDQVSPAESLVGRGQSSESSTKVVVLLVVLAVAASAFGPLGAGVGGSGFVSMVLMLGGLWLLYQRRPEPPASRVSTSRVSTSRRPSRSTPAPPGPHRRTRTSGRSRNRNHPGPVRSPPGRNRHPRRIRCCSAPRHRRGIRSVSHRSHGTCPSRRPRRPSCPRNSRVPG
ncbi:MAG: hypothetical protein DCC47_13230 [Acidobacteria bacterium]|nr:MAG: hypothetical protein DCC47_13230 [Acidobacteriota bacterium]